MSLAAVRSRCFLPSRTRSFFSIPSAAQSSTPPETETFEIERNFGYCDKDLYQIVADVASYPSFLPFCTFARLSHTTSDHLHGGKPGDVVKLDAELGVGFMGVSEEYMSRVTCTKWSKVTAQASNTPLFHQLDTIWNLNPASTTPNEPDTKVSLSLKYSFVNPLHQSLARIAFSKVSEDILSAFDTRTRQVLGQPRKSPS